MLYFQICLRFTNTIDTVFLISSTWTFTFICQRHYRVVRTFVKKYFTHTKIKYMATLK